MRFQRAAPSSPRPCQETVERAAIVANDEEMNELLRQLQDARSQRAREQKKVSELSQQLTSLLQENSTLEEQLAEWRNKAQDVKSLQDEINTLEEVRFARVNHVLAHFYFSSDLLPLFPRTRIARLSLPTRPIKKSVLMQMRQVNLFTHRKSCSVR